MPRWLAKFLCKVRIHILTVHDGVAVDFSRTDQPRTNFSTCACGRRMGRFRKPER